MGCSWNKMNILVTKLKNSRAAISEPQIWILASLRPRDYWVSSIARGTWRWSISFCASNASHLNPVFSLIINMGAHSHLKGISVQEPAVDSDNQQTASVVEIYTSLIQQYLSVLCVDNATFFAERLVATSRTSHSLYLLALCYYRDEKPQRAVSILEQAKEPSSTMQFLLAKCHFDLEAYGPAEEALLRQCRVDFRKQGRLHEDMQDFIRTTSVSEYVTTKPFLIVLNKLKICSPVLFPMEPRDLTF